MTTKVQLEAKIAELNAQLNAQRSTADVEPSTSQLVIKLAARIAVGVAYGIVLGMAANYASMTLVGLLGFGALNTIAQILLLSGLIAMAWYTVGAVTDTVINGAVSAYNNVRAADITNKAIAKAQSAQSWVRSRFAQVAEPVAA